MSSSLCTSVSTGTPSSRLTLARISRPFSRPGPRKVVPLLRLALSKLLLKMKGMPRLPVISFSWPATSICNCSDSITQGPAIRKKGWSRPMSKPQSFMVGLDQAFRPRPWVVCRLLVQRGLDVGVEQRVTVPGRGLELGVELHAHVPGVHALRQLDHFGQVLALRQRRDHQTGLAQLVEVVHVGLVAVAVALGDHGAVDLVGQRAGRHVGALCAQAHGAAEVGVGVALS